jgi:hypothetical protein
MISRNKFRSYSSTGCRLDVATLKIIYRSNDMKKIFCIFLLLLSGNVHAALNVFA